MCVCVCVCVYIADTEKVMTALEEADQLFRTLRDGQIKVHVHTYIFPPSLSLPPSLLLCLKHASGYNSSEEGVTSCD